MEAPLGDITLALERLVAAQPRAAALEAPGRTALRYGALGQQIGYVRERLGTWGIERGDIVAGLVTSRPEMACVSATLPAAATFAPLGASMTRDAYAELLQRLRPKAVLVPDQEDHALRAAARALGLAEIHLVAAGGCAGQFALDLARPSASLDTPPQAGPQCAYVVATSGTTGRAKLVPMDHANIVRHARLMAEWFRYSPTDTGCHLVPMHLGHALRNALMVPLLAGIPVVCLGEADVDGFFHAMEQFQPTFLTAGFAIHRALLDRAPSFRQTLARGRLRFLRIGAGRLEPEEIDRLEQTFGVPAIKGLSLTEVSAVTQDPLPPGPRKRDAVGVPVGAEVAIMLEPGRFAPLGASGEVVVRGPLVFRGYLDDPQLTAQSFAGEWFRTGDLGHLDADGYLYLTGRIKEIINRGGEKISPLQIDSALATLPGVREAATFGIPHPSLGEEVVAAVVRQDGASIDEPAILEHARRSVGLTCSPRRIYFLERLPRTDSGKLLRGELPRLVGAKPGPARPPSAGDGEAPASTTETVIGALFAATLRAPTVAHDGDFFLLGGDSLSGSQLLARVKEVFGVELPLASLFQEAATVSGMARAVERVRYGAAAANRSATEAALPSTGRLAGD